MQKVIRDILEKWSLLLEEKHIVIRPDIFAEKELDDRIQMAVVDMYIILRAGTQSKERDRLYAGRECGYAVSVYGKQWPLSG